MARLPELQPTIFPQLFLHSTSNRLECRVYNWKVIRDSSGTVLEVQKNCWSWLDGLCLGFLAYFFAPSISHNRTSYILSSALFLSLYVYWRCSSIIWESVVAIPPHGVQIETHRGLAGIPFSVSRRFIPTFLFRDLIINEALRRWNVVYYLSVLSVTHDSEYKLDIIFENILPEFSILQKVQEELKRAMLSSH